MTTARRLLSATLGRKIMWHPSSLSVGTSMEPTWNRVPGSKTAAHRGAAGAPRRASVAGHFKIPHPAVAAPKTDRPFPVAKARCHPAPRIQRATLDRKRQPRNCDAPRDRNLAAFDLGKRRRRHLDISGCELFGFAGWQDPVAGTVVVAVGLAQPKQHEFFALVEMQRKPVPTALIRRERLAAPFPIHPGPPGNLCRLVVDGDAARYLEIRLAVIIRGLSALGFLAVSTVALQHQRPIGVEPQRIAEIRTRCGELERRDRVVAYRIKPAHLP